MPFKAFNSRSFALFLCIYTDYFTTALSSVLLSWAKIAPATQRVKELERLSTVLLPACLPGETVPLETPFTQQKTQSRQLSVGVLMREQVIIAKSFLILSHLFRHGWPLAWTTFCCFGHVLVVWGWTVNCLSPPLLTEPKHGVEWKGH